MKLDDARAVKLQLMMRTEVTERRRSTTRGPLAKRRSVATPDLAVGIAPTEREGDYKIAIRVREETADSPQAVQRIAAVAAGEVDVRFTGPIYALPAVAAATIVRNLGVGMSIGHSLSTAGTLGCFASDPAGRIGIVSNNHVIANEDEGSDGDDIVQPGPKDGGAVPDDVVATLAGSYPKLKTRGEKTVDCAFGHLIDGVNFDPFALTDGDRLEPVVDEIKRRDRVSKVGRTTGRTEGIISAFDVDDLVIDYPNGGFSVMFDNQIEIESTQTTPFSDRGDSGSVVFNRRFRPIGLLFATSLDRGLTWANPMQNVLDALGVQLVT
jgi:hypothetical protein